MSNVWLHSGGVVREKVPEFILITAILECHHDIRACITCYLPVYVF